MRLILLLSGLMALFMAVTGPVRADEAELRAAIAKFAEAKKFKDTEAVIEEIAALGDPAAVTALNELSEGRLMVRESDGEVFIIKGSKDPLALLDPITLEQLGTAPEDDLSKIKIKNSIRRMIADAVSGLTLRAKDAHIRIEAAETIFSRPDPDIIETLDGVIAEEQDAGVRQAFVEARAAAVLSSDMSDDAKTDAIDILNARGGRDVLPILTAASNSDAEAVAEAARTAIASVEERLMFWSAGQNIWYGISLGSVLLLAAIGLAITFGVMGVINMAHGEFIMMGAYTGYVVQQLIPNYTVSILVALPLAFAVTFAAGVAMERLVIRWLYDRPLETLLATFGISIALQQIAKNIFGTQARPLTSPSWLDGAWTLNDVVSISYIRIAIFVLALIFLALFLFIMKKTRLGLETRAVTQNPRMAASMGINPDKVNMLTFGLGSGIAGIAGVAIGLFAKVTSELGQDYIVQSFMTVVVGGVGNIWGTLAGAAMIGFFQKGVEWLNPSNTLAAQTYMIIFIIIFIQFRPRGIIALKGRAAGD